MCFSPMVWEALRELRFVEALTTAQSSKPGRTSAPTSTSQAGTGRIGSLRLSFLLL